MHVLSSYRLGIAKYCQCFKGFLLLFFCFLMGQGRVLGGECIIWGSEGAPGLGQEDHSSCSASVVLLVGVSQGVPHDGPNCDPRLLGRGDDLCGRQQEAIVPSVPELKAKGVLDAAVIGPVHSDPTGQICTQKGKETPQNGRTGCGHGVQKYPECKVGPGGQTPTHPRP